MFFVVIQDRNLVVRLGFMVMKLRTFAVGSGTSTDASTSTDTSTMRRSRASSADEGSLSVNQEFRA